MKFELAEVHDVNHHLRLVCQIAVVHFVDFDQMSAQTEVDYAELVAQAEVRCLEKQESLA